MSFTFLFLQDLCKDLYQRIDVVDEERYDIGLKVSKNDKEVSAKELVGRKFVPSFTSSNVFTKKTE